MDSKNRAKIFLTLLVVVVVSLVLIHPVYSGTGSPGPQPDPTPINPCPTGYECLTPSDAKDKFGLGGYGIYEKYSDDLCGDLAISTGRYCYKWLKPCLTGYECMTGDDAKDKFGEGMYVVSSSTYVCGYKGHYENPTKRFCYKSSKIEPIGEEEGVDVCSSICPDPTEVGLGECIGYECSGGLTSLQHYKRESVVITKCKYENGSVAIFPSAKPNMYKVTYKNGTVTIYEATKPDMHIKAIDDECTGPSELTEYFCQSLTRAIPGLTRGSTKVYKVGKSTVTCPYGCENGACICRDTDGGNNCWVKGSVVGAEDMYTDFCSVQSLIEYYTVIENDECIIKDDDATCEEGKICEDGACVTGTLCGNGMQDIGEVGIDCGGDCPTPCCENGFRDSALGEVDVDCGGPCIPCCENGIKNWFERDVDCGITCPPCCTPDSDCETLACPPCDDANQKEFGIEYAISYYPPCDDVEDREDGDEAAEGFKEVMEDDVGWTCVFNMGGNAKERHFRDTTKDGEDWRYVDDVDIVYFASHGGMWCNHSVSPPYCAFSGCFGAEEDHCSINSKNVKLGDRDLEWLVLATCHSLENNGDNYEWYYAWRESFAGLHMICGFNDVSYRGPTTHEVGEDFADNLDDEETVASAWLDAGTDWLCCNKPAVMAVNQYTMDNDHIPGKGVVVADVKNPDYGDMVWRGYNECWELDAC